MVSFIRSGNVAAAKAELSSVRTSVNGLMADGGTGALTAGVGLTGATLTGYTGGVTGHTLGDYLTAGSNTYGTYSIAVDGTVTITAYSKISATDWAAINPLPSTW